VVSRNEKRYWILNVFLEVLCLEEVHDAWPLSDARVVEKAFKRRSLKVGMRKDPPES